MMRLIRLWISSLVKISTKRPTHSYIEGMLTLYNRDDPVDVITLSQVLKEKGALDKVGGTEYLASLAEATATSAGILYHAEICERFIYTKKPDSTMFSYI